MIFLLKINSTSYAKEDIKGERHSIVDFYYIYENNEVKSIIDTLTERIVPIDAVGNVSENDEIPYENVRERFDFELNAFLIKFYTNGLYLTEQEKLGCIRYIKECKEVLENDKWDEISFLNIVSNHIKLDEKLIKYMEEENDENSIKLITKNKNNLEKIYSRCSESIIGNIQKEKISMFKYVYASELKKDNYIKSEDKSGIYIFIFILILFLLLLIKIKIHIKRSKKDDWKVKKYYVLLY